jgi:hypothetical protein
MHRTRLGIHQIESLSKNTARDGDPSNMFLCTGIGDLSPSVVCQVTESNHVEKTCNVSRGRTHSFGRVLVDHSGCRCSVSRRAEVSLLRQLQLDGAISPITDQARMGRRISHPPSRLLDEPLFMRRAKAARRAT